MDQSHRSRSWWRRPRRATGQFLASIGIALALLAGPPLASAAEEDTTVDGRLEGYGGKTNDSGTSTGISTVILQKSGVGGTWIIFMILSVLGVSVLFKTSKRNASGG